MDKRSAELLDLLQKVRRYSRKKAFDVMRGLAPEGQVSMLEALRLEHKGQQRLPMAIADPMPAPRPPRAKKVAYSLLLPPDMLEAVKAAADRDGSSASQFIRTAIAKHLGRVK